MAFNLQAFLRDITLRRELERQVARLSRVRSALQAATSVLLRSRDEAMLRLVNRYLGLADISQAEWDALFNDVSHFLLS